MKLVFATHNSGKLVEMRSLLSDLPIEVLSADEAGVTEDVVEDGATFEDNARKKARFVHERTTPNPSLERRGDDLWAVADDSGCCIEALDGRPGVLSARWAGEGATDQTLVEHTLNEMKDVPEGKRQAWFQTALCLVAPNGREWMFEGRINGRIAVEPRGTPRPKLPYDAIFIPEGHDRTFAEMSLEEKNSMSHRGQAFQQLREFFKTQL